MDNRDVIEIFGQLLNSNKEIMMLNSRQTGKSHTSAALVN